MCSVVAACDTVVHELLLLQFNVDLDANLGQQCRKVLDVDFAIVVCTSLDDFLDLIKDLQPSQRRLILDDLDAISHFLSMGELAEDEDLNALGNRKLFSEPLDQLDGRYHVDFLV